jgi:hypothetical protein
MMNNVNNLLTILPTELPMENSIDNSVGINDTSSYFFGFVLIIFSHCNSLGIYRKNIFIGIFVCIYQFSGSGTSHGFGLDCVKEPIQPKSLSY